MSRLVFLRHAHSTANESGLLSGRLTGVTLSSKGYQQALTLVERIGATTFDQVRISPLQRCHETIEPWLTSKYGNGIKQFIIDDGLNEVDYGSWSGRKLSSLRKEALWKEIQHNPKSVTFPGGEKLARAQSRSVPSVQAAHKNRKNGIYLFISHGDIIKAAIAALIGIPFNKFQNLVVNPASLSVLDFDGNSARLLSFNDTTQPITEIAKSTRAPRLLLGGGSGPQGARK